jgi:SAM-dependent methyltransferase
MDSHHFDLYGSYQNFADEVMGAVRRETFGADIGQNSWITVEEYDRLLSCLGLATRGDANVLEVACGSGGPALHMASTLGCRVTGIDMEQHAVATAMRLAQATGLAERASFTLADANAPLPFEDEAFDGIVCIDAMNHLPDRLGVLREWRRVLRSGRRAVFTDPVVITGAVTNEELALRSSIGLFVFVPSGENERLIDQAELALVQREDLSAGAAVIASRWAKARDHHRAKLESLEGAERFANLQQFFQSVQRLTSQRRLSRIAYVVEKSA